MERSPYSVCRVELPYWHLAFQRFKIHDFILPPNPPYFATINRYSDGCPDVMIYLMTSVLRKLLTGRLILLRGLGGWDSPTNAWNRCLKIFLGQSSSWMLASCPLLSWRRVCPTFLVTLEWKTWDILLDFLTLELDTLFELYRYYLGSRLQSDYFLLDRKLIVEVRVG